MKLRITVEGQTYDVDVEFLDGAPAPRAATPASAPPAQSAPAAPAQPAPAAPPTPPAPAPTPAAAQTPAASGGGQVVAPIAGTVTKVNVAVGDTVNVNDVVVVMEAMKMESNVASPAAGTVKQVHVSPGDAVTQGQALVELE